MIVDQSNTHVLRKIISIIEDSVELSMDGDKRQVYANFIADVETEAGWIIQNAKIHIDFAGDVFVGMR